MHDLLGYPGVATLITGAQAVAWAILGTRTAWEAFQLATLRKEGAPTDPGSLLKRVALTGAAIAGGPWVAEQALVVGNDLAQAVAHVGLGVGLGSISGNLTALSANLTLATLWVPVLLVGGVVLVILCFLQAIVRTVETTLAAIVAPVMALGFLGGGGTADVWWRELLVLAGAQSVQLTLLYLAASFLVAPTVGAASNFLDPFLFVGPSGSRGGRRQDAPDVWACHAGDARRGGQPPRRPPRRAPARTGADPPPSAGRQAEVLSDYGQFMGSGAGQAFGRCPQTLEAVGGPGGTRTHDPLIKSLIITSA